MILIFCSSVMYVGGNIINKQNTEKKEVIEMDDKDKKEKPETPPKNLGSRNDFPLSETCKLEREEPKGRKIVTESETPKENSSSEK
ncbi:MAG: hypothetical protein HY769_09540 [Candidatus Stahlbacteria bacterium]|nr:hypothetical protein [Candidatus Stahlbacteria bacterium]